MRQPYGQACENGDTRSRDKVDDILRKVFPEKECAYVFGHFSLCIRMYTGAPVPVG
jgi:hypothetical protein